MLNYYTLSYAPLAKVAAIAKVTAIAIALALALALVSLTLVTGGSKTNASQTVLDQEVARLSVGMCFDDASDSDSWQQGDRQVVYYVSHPENQKLVAPLNLVS